MAGSNLMRWCVVALAAALTFLLLDLIWITMVAGPGFRAAFGDVMLDSPRIAPAFVFYLLYMVGLCFFAIAPGLRSGRSSIAFWHGAFLGLIAYATYDFTTLAILKPYTWQLAIMDTAWGAAVSAVSAAMGASAGIWWSQRK